MKHLYKKGVWIADKRGTYCIDYIEDRYVRIKDVLRTREGKIVYGKQRYIGIKDLDNYVVV